MDVTFTLQVGGFPRICSCFTVKFFKMLLLTVASLVCEVLVLTVAFLVCEVLLLTVAFLVYEVLLLAVAFLVCEVTCSSFRPFRESGKILQGHISKRLLCLAFQNEVFVLFYLL